MKLYWIWSEHYWAMRPELYTTKWEAQLEIDNNEWDAEEEIKEFNLIE